MQVPNIAAGGKRSLKMALSILNNISALTAQNQLSTTQANLQRTLTQLSSGLKINSGADDAAGLSIANGLSANIAALTQSQQNASNGIGLLQTADGAYSQVTALLNRAVTLATEAANSTLNGAGGTQAVALQAEFFAIRTNINTIGSRTNFNGSSVFGSALNIFMSDGTTTGNMAVSSAIGALTDTGLGLTGNGAGTATLTGTAAAQAGDTVVVGTTTYTFATAITAGSSANTVATGSTLAQSLANLAAAINGTGTSGAGNQYATGTGINAQVSATDLTGTSVVIASKDSNQVGITGNARLMLADSATQTSAGTALNLNSNAGAQATLTALTAAISSVAGSRGAIGAAINQLQSSSNIMNTQVQNLQSATNSVMNADIGKTVAEMTQFNILQSTGMSALQQANQSQQAVLKLLQ
jgi:flagellin